MKFTKLHDSVISFRLDMLKKQTPENRRGQKKINFNRGTILMEKETENSKKNRVQTTGCRVQTITPSVPWASPVTLHKTTLSKAASNPNNSLKFYFKTNPSQRPRGLILETVEAPC